MLINTFKALQTEEISVKTFTDYIVKYYRVPKDQEATNQLERAKQFVLDAIKPQNRSKYLNNWTNDFMDLKDVLEYADFFKVIKKLERDINSIEGISLNLRRYDTLFLKFKVETTLGKSFYEVLKELHKGERHMSTQMISNYFHEEFGIKISRRTINKWLQIYKLQQLHFEQMAARYV